MYIVTGGAGFIGSAMIWRLNQAGIDDILVVDNLASTEKWRNLVNRRYQDYMHRDEFLRCLRESKTAFSTVRGVIHLGACSSTTERNADFLMENNLHYSQTVCRFALERGARLVNASSAATYGNGDKGFSDDLETMMQLRPLNMYGYSKHLFDLWAHREKLLDTIASVKFFNVYGPNEYHKGDMRSVVCKAVEQIRETGRMKLFASDRPAYPDGGQMRDFVYVKDVVEVLFWLLEHPEVNGVRNLGSGKARTWNELVRAVFTSMDLETQIEYVPMPEHLKGKYQYFTQAEMKWLADKQCDVAFHSLEEGVNDYVRNYLRAEDRYL